MNVGSPSNTRSESSASIRAAVAASAQAKASRMKKREATRKAAEAQADPMAVFKNARAQSSRVARSSSAVREPAAMTQDQAFEVLKLGTNLFLE
jgi:hypothetical protein